MQINNNSGLLRKKMLFKVELRLSIQMLLMLAPLPAPFAGKPLFYLNKKHRY